MLTIAFIKKTVLKQLNDVIDVMRGLACPGIFLLSFASMMFFTALAEGGTRELMVLLRDLKFMALLPFMEREVGMFMLVLLLMSPAIAIISMSMPLCCIYGIVRRDVSTRWLGADLSNWIPPDSGPGVIDARAMLDRLKGGLGRHFLFAAMLFIAASMFLNSYMRHFPLHITVMLFIMMVMLSVPAWINFTRWFRRIDCMEDMGLVVLCNGGC